MKDSVSIIIAAYNEEKNIQNAVKSVLYAVDNMLTDYEIIIVDDGSTDKTGKIINKLAGQNKKIIVIHHEKNMGFGCAIRTGINNAGKKYITGFPGDNDMAANSLRELIIEREKDDVILSYMVNPGERPLLRRLASRCFVLAMNTLFGLKLKYYNGYFVCRSQMLKDLPLCSTGLAIFAEAIVRLLKKGASYREIPFVHTGRKLEQSKAISWKSVKETLGTIGVLLKEAGCLGRFRLRPR